MYTEIIVETTMKNVFNQECYAVKRSFSLTDPFANLDAQGVFNFLESIKNKNLTRKAFSSVKDEFIYLASKSRSEGLLSPKIEEMLIEGFSSDNPMVFLSSLLGDSVDNQTLNEILNVKLYYI